jgi:hypothetical protein
MAKYITRFEINFKESKNDHKIFIDINTFDNFILSLGTAQDQSLQQTLFPIIELKLKNNLIIAYDPDYDFRKIILYLERNKINYLYEDYSYDKKIIQIKLIDENTSIFLLKKKVESSYRVTTIQKSIYYAKNLEPLNDFWLELYDSIIYLIENKKNIYINNHIYTNIRTWDYSKGFEKPIPIHSSIGHHYEYIPELANIILQLFKEKGNENIFHTFIKSIIHI